MKRPNPIFIIICSLLFCICLVGTAAADNHSRLGTTHPTGGLLKPVEMDKMQKLSAADVDKLNAKMAAYTPAEETLLINNAPVFYYYEQLEPLEQEMYDIMLTIANDPVEDNIGIMMTDKNPGSDSFFESFCKAYYALTFDHPELFWLYYCIENSFSFSSDEVVRNGIYYVYFQLEKTYDLYETRMTEFNKAAQNFLAGIDRNASEYEIARQIHDKLINTVSYNYPVLENADGENLAHTAYGALVKDSNGNSNKPVCDGYSLAYEYLLQQCGITAVYICGEAGEDELSAGGHAWSMVKLDDIWFEVDSTWDDSWNDGLENADAYTLEMMSDYYFHSKLEHYMFLISTDHMTNYKADVNYFTYYTKDGLYYFTFQPDSVHIRDSNKGNAVVFSTVERAINNLIDKAPVAAFDYVLNW